MTLSGKLPTLIICTGLFMPLGCGSDLPSDGPSAGAGGSSLGAGGAFGAGGSETGGVTGATGGGAGAGGDSLSSGGNGSGAGGELAVTGGSSSGGSGGSPDVSSGGSGSGGSDPEGSGGQVSETGAKYPFPQNAPLAHCVFPTNYSNQDVQAAYDLWKTTVVTSEGAGGHLRVRKPDSGSQIDSTVSEGIGYGMLLSVYMDDQEVFDELWLYEQMYENGNGLMDWEISPNGSVIGSGAALDGDEDMAWALIMADRQWGGQGKLDDTYLNFAIELVNAMWEHEFDHTREDMPLPGDTWGNVDITNISYFAPAYYRVFGKITGNEAGWNNAIKTSYDIIERSLNATSKNQNNGLVPAWCNSAGTPVEAYAGAPLYFQNDSTRTPFRVGQDYCYYGEPRALAYMEKITSFYTGVGVANIVDGYNLDGSPHPDFGLGPASFVGPAAVGASYSASNQTFIDEAYAALITQQLTAGTIYYQKSWAALSLLMMTGGFYEFPAP